MTSGWPRIKSASSLPHCGADKTRANVMKYSRRQRSIAVLFNSVPRSKDSEGGQTAIWRELNMTSFQKRFISPN